MRILITGAAGMLGSDLAAALKTNHTILGTGRHCPLKPITDFKEADLAVSGKAEELCAQFKPDLIFHTAAMTDVDRCELHPEEAIRNNVETTRFICGAAKKHSAFLIYFSTDYVFDGKKNSPYHEEDPVNPQSQYGRSKALAEQIIRESLDRHLIFRVSWLYGKNGRSFLKTLVEKSVTQTDFKVVKDQAGAPTSTADIARAIAEFLNREAKNLMLFAGQTFHLSNTGSTTWFEFAKFIFNAKHLRHIQVVPISSQELNRPAKRPENSIFSLEKTRKVLGIQLRPWQEAASDFLQTLEIDPAHKL